MKWEQWEQYSMCSQCIDKVINFVENLRKSEMIWNFQRENGFFKSF